jgi:SnoaL-like domain
MTILGDTDSGFRVASMGHYEDVLVKRDGHWLIKNRKLLR